MKVNPKKTRVEDKQKGLQTSWEARAGTECNPFSD